MIVPEGMIKPRVYSDAEGYTVEVDWYNTKVSGVPYREALAMANLWAHVLNIESCRICGKQVRMMYLRGSGLCSQLCENKAKFREQ